MPKKHTHTPRTHNGAFPTEDNGRTKIFTYILKELTGILLQPYLIKSFLPSFLSPYFSLFLFIFEFNPSSSSSSYYFFSSSSYSFFFLSPHLLLHLLFIFCIRLLFFLLSFHPFNFTSTFPPRRSLSPSLLAFCHLPLHPRHSQLRLPFFTIIISLYIFVLKIIMAANVLFF